jgi:molecular chaperone GrpE
MKAQDKNQKKPINEENNSSNPSNDTTLDESSLQGDSVDDNLSSEEVLFTNEAGSSSQDSEMTQADYEIKITQLERQLAEEKDKSIRALAEIENVKRRTQKDLENAHKFAVEGLVKSLVSVLDSFDGGKKAIPEEQIEAIKGIAMIEDSFLNVLQEHGVEIVQPNAGEDFNPELHQAMSMQENKEFSSNQIINTVQRGFAVKGRLIRPAMVIVSS